MCFVQLIFNLVFTQVRNSTFSVRLDTICRYLNYSLTLNRFGLLFLSRFDPKEHSFYIHVCIYIFIFSGSS